MGLEPSHISKIGDFTTQTWADIFFDCHSITQGGVTLIHYPDGECYYNQDQLTINIFGILRDEVVRAITPKTT